MTADAVQPGIDLPGYRPRTKEYLRLLLILLLTASFFDGYDGGILDIIKPQIQDTYGLTEAALAWVSFGVKLGAVFAFFVALSADWIGRRPILLWSVIAYTFFTGLTAFAPNVYFFTLFQFAAQIFLGAEYAVAVTMISEEFPPAQRGRALGKFTLVTAAGVILVPIVALSPLTSTALEWRVLYLIGLGPLVLMAFLRRRIKETSLFEARKAQVDAGTHAGPDVWAPWEWPHRYYMMVLAFVTFFRAVAVFSATGWWVWYAEREVGLAPTAVLLFLVGAYGLGIIGYYTNGRLIDRYGRRNTTIVYGLLAWVFATLLFNVRGAAAQAILLILAVFFGLGITPGLNAFYTELFPTEIRATAAAWARNMVEIPAFLIGPLLVGLLGDHGTGTLGAMSNVITIIFGLMPVTVFLVWRYLPETKGRHLEILDAKA